MKLCSILREKTSVMPTPPAPILWMTRGMQGFWFSLLRMGLDTLETPEKPASHSSAHPSLAHPSPMSPHLLPARPTPGRPSLPCTPDIHTNTHTLSYSHTHTHTTHRGTSRPPWVAPAPSSAERSHRPTPSRASRAWCSQSFVLRQLSPLSSHSLRGLSSDHRSRPELQSPPIVGKTREESTKQTTHRSVPAGDL